MLWLYLLLLSGLFVVVGSIVGVRRKAIVYWIRLLHAKIVADRFYSRYPGIVKNIVYGDTPGARLDLYKPSPAGPHPVLVWVHGGSWQNGSKELYAPLAQRVIPENLVVVISGYTLHPHANAFQQAQEIARMFAWVRENIAQYGGDPNRIILGGQSAGAHLTGLVVLDPTYLAAVNHSPCEVCGWYGIAGPYSIPAQHEYETTVHRNDAGLLFDVFGTRENFERGSPISFVRPDTPPILLIHGADDETVPLATSGAMQDALQNQGAKSEFKIYPRAGHAGLLLGALAQKRPRLIEDLVTFAKSCAPVSSVACQERSGPSSAGMPGASFDDAQDKSPISNPSTMLRTSH